MNFLYNRQPLNASFPNAKKTNGGFNFEGRNLINKARIITRSNFVYLVFDNSSENMKWIYDWDNALFTNKFDDAEKITATEMNLKDVLIFIE